MTRLIKSLGDLGVAGAATPMTLPEAPSRSRDRAAVSAGAETSFKSYQLSSLISMISDCYWSDEDSYAAWIWGRMDVEQRRQLLENMPFMADYSNFLADKESSPFPYVNHAYYLNPLPCNMTSQKDMTELVRVDNSLWHILSPIRQAHLQLRLEERIRCMSAPHKKYEKLVFTDSQMRALSVSGQWGDLSADDETQLLKDPWSVPVHLRSQIKSLVWLSTLPEEKIKEKLEKLDAKSLATAWVGPEELLNRLEGFLPEKKRELIRAYKDRIPATRDSDAFNWLWEESIKDVAS